MKKFIGCIVILSLMCGNLLAQNTVSELSENAEEYYDNIKEQVVKNAKKATSFKTREAYDDIMKSLVKLRNLNYRIKNTEDITPEVDVIIKELREISQTYRKVAALQSSIGKFRGERLLELKETQKKTAKYAELMEVERNRLRDEASFAQERKENEMDELEKKKLEITIKAKHCIVNAMEGQINIWRGFEKAQDRLISKLELIGRKVDLLLFTLQTNSKVYQEVANVTKLRRSAKEAFANLETLSEMEVLLLEIKDNWDEVDNLVQEISTHNFNLVM